MNSARSPSASLFLLCLCSGCWAYGFGLEFPLASRWLQNIGRSETYIGFNTGTHFLGVVLTGIFVPVLMRRAGRACVFAGLLLSGVGVAAFPWGGGSIGWFALRFVAGIGGALSMISLETLININAPPHRRARDFAFYACSIGSGFALGTFIGLHLFEIAPELSFALGGCVTLMAIPLVPLLPAFPKISVHEEVKGPLHAPLLSFGSAWSQGFLEAGMLALLPLYLRSVGVSDGGAGTLMGGILIGVLVCQLPIGWLADRFGREKILVGCFVIVGVGLAMVPRAERSIEMPFWLFAIGVCSGAFYPLGLALLGERLPQSQLPHANAWFLGINSFGSLVSPIVSGPIMERYGEIAMFWTGEAVIVGMLAIWSLSRWGRSMDRSRHENHAA